MTNDASTPPRMWLTAFDSLSSGAEEGDSDCNCDCRSEQLPVTRASAAALALDQELMMRRRLVQPQPLHTQQLDPEHLLVAHVGGDGAIGVMDRACSSLFDRFRTPQALAEIAPAQLPCPPPEAAAMLTLLEEAGLLIPADDSPAARDDPPEVLTAWLHLTNACNLRCHYCYLHKTSDHMSAETARAAVDAVFRSAIRQGFQRVKLKYAGGEASIRARLVVELHDYALAAARRAGIALDAVLLSNGVMIPDWLIDALASRGIRLMVSLDGRGPEHDAQRPFVSGRGSFALVDATLGRLLARGLVPGISITLTAHNLRGLPQLVEYVLDRDLPFTISFYRESEVLTPEALRFSQDDIIAAMRAAFATIERRLPRRSLLGALLDRASLQGAHDQPCGVGKSYMVVDHNGSVAKCQMEIGHTVGTIALVDPLAAVQADRSGLLNLPVAQKEGCSSCDWRNWCAGGCPSLTYRMTGRYDLRSPNCGIYKALLPEVLRLEGLRLLAHTTALTPGLLHRPLERAASPAEPARSGFAAL